MDFRSNLARFESTLDLRKKKKKTFFFLEICFSYFPVTIALQVLGSRWTRSLCRTMLPYHPLWRSRAFVSTSTARSSCPKTCSSRGRLSTPTWPTRQSPGNRYHHLLVIWSIRTLIALYTNYGNMLPYEPTWGWSGWITDPDFIIIFFFFFSTLFFFSLFSPLSPCRVPFVRSWLGSRATMMPPWMHASTPSPPRSRPARRGPLCPLANGLARSSPC